MTRLEPREILLTKLRYLGDVLLTTPAIRTLKQAYPQARITMVVNRGTEEVIRHNPHLSRVLLVDRPSTPWGTWRLVRQLRDRRYDFSIDFFSGDRAAYLSAVSGCRCRIGFVSDEGMRRLLYNRQFNIRGRIHTVERNLLLLQQALGLPPGDSRLEIHPAPADEEFADRWLQARALAGAAFAVVHPGARFWYKRWPGEQWAPCLDELQRRFGLRVVLAGGPQEQEIAQAIRSRTTTPVVSAVGETSILQLAALLRRARLFLGNDSGPMHVAAAVGTPVVALFGPTEPEVWRPWGDGHAVVTKHDGCAVCVAGSCDRGSDNCMARISVDDVLQAVTARLEASGQQPPTVP